MQPILNAVLESARPRYTKPLTVRGSFLFLSDFEIPFHNAKFINGCFTLAKLYDVNQCVWGGDAVHFEAFSPFPGGDQDAEKELTQIDEYLGGFLEPFEKITWIMGNHDDRAQRMLNRKITNEKALRMILSDDNREAFKQKVTLSEYYWCHAGRTWMLEHGKNNAMNPTAVAQAFVKKFHKNVIQAHTHKAGAVRVNERWAIESGCGVDIKRLAYPNLRHSTHTEMQNGAVLMLDHNGDYAPVLITPDTMDFLLWQASRSLPPSKNGTARARNARKGQ